MTEFFKFLTIPAFAIALAACASEQSLPPQKVAEAAPAATAPAPIVIEPTPAAVATTPAPAPTTPAASPQNCTLYARYTTTGPFRGSWSSDSCTVDAAGNVKGMIKIMGGNCRRAPFHGPVTGPLNVNVCGSRAKIKTSGMSILDYDGYPMRIFSMVFTTS